MVDPIAESDRCENVLRKWLRDEEGDEWNGGVLNAKALMAFRGARIFIVQQNHKREKENYP